ncbi:VENN motif pre-toxin domain-containing protein [Neisseria weixii]|uniref:VENN motif pre-toxin domain-containing protein n=1 Tax=Neisseria weixii TaxID=1853276 RepID=UPI001E353E3D|nr:VENN motif pre-toxin domain-containing protein [Neisseria weixii]
MQRSVSQDFSRNVQEARTEINRKAEGYKALAKAAEDNAAQALQNGDLNAYREAVQTANEHHQKADNWQKGGVALAAVATGLSAPTDSALGIAAATASPAAAYQVGQYFKGLAKQNSDGKLTAKQETAHILAYAVLGAATAAAGGNNALAGAISAGSAEAAAPLIGNYLYGEKDGSKLTAEQKETVTAITNLLGTATGAAVGNSATNAAQGSLNAQGAVENNYGVSAISKGRRVIRIIQRGKRLTPKDALPVAEAGLVVAAACAITGNCDASLVLKDVWSGEFEDSYMASGNTDNANDKKTNAQSAAVSQSSAGAPMPPDDEPNPKEQNSSKKVSEKTLDELLIDANKPINEQGISQAARAWAKHAGRPGGTFEPLKGNVQQQNQYVSNWIKEVINNPKTIKTQLSRGGVSYRLPNGRGVAFGPDGRVNLLDPSTNIRNLIK